MNSAGSHSIAVVSEPRTVEKFLLLILFSSFSLISFCQFEYYGKKDSSVERKREVLSRHPPGDKNLIIYPVAINSRDFGVKIGGGAKLQIFLGKRFSVDADLVIANDYVHAGPGLIAIPFWLLNLSGTPVESDEGGSLSGFLFIAAATLLSIEHISYHIPLQKDTEIAPYVSLLRFRFITIPENSGNVNSSESPLSFATGVRLNKYFGRFFISPYAEYCVGYSDHISTLSVGVGAGFSFLSK
jgi:hypothetical protein